MLTQLQVDGSGDAHPIVNRGEIMTAFIHRAIAAFSASALFAMAPAQAELVSPKNPAAIVSVVESQGLSAKLVTKSGENPYIESASNGIKFLILFLNCDDNKQNCTTLQYYMGYSDADATSLERINEWNKTKRFARAYRDNDGDPVLEMDVDLDFDGLPRQNVGESLKTWVSLMNSYHGFLFDKKD